MKMRNASKLICLFWLLICSQYANSMSYSANHLQVVLPVTELAILSEQVSGVHAVEDIGRDSNIPWVTISSVNDEFNIPAGITWLKVKLNNERGDNEHVYFTLSNLFQMADVKLYSQHNNLPLFEISATLSRANFYYGSLEVRSHSTHNLFIRINSDTAIRNNINIMNTLSFEQLLAEREFLNGTAIGGMMFLSLVFWILFFATGVKLIGILAGYFTLRGLFLSILLGSNLYFLYGQNADIRGFELPIMAALSSYFYLWFASTLFQLKALFSRLHRITKIVRWSTLTYIPIGFMVSVDTNMLLSAFVMMGVMLYLLSLGIYLVYQKTKLAKLFSVVMVLHLLFTLAIALGGFFQIELFSQREPIHVFSFWLNALLVIFLISRLYFYQMKDKQRVQLEALEHAVASQKAQEKLIKLQEDSQEELEQRVQERTLELNIALNELESLNQELERKNTMDALTTLYNRRFYDQKITAEYRRSKRNLTKLSIILIDVDHFKKVNDQYGHLAGDQCLYWVAQQIKDSIKRSTDLACRYGGEEFILILPDTEAEGAMAFAESIRESIDTGQFNYQEHPIPLTISCGVSTYTQQADAAVEDLFLAADKALFNAKHSGRNQVQYQEIRAENNI